MSPVPVLCWVSHSNERISPSLSGKSTGSRFHLYSANARDISEKLDQGLMDFGLMYEPFDKRKYEHMPLPCADTFDILMPEGHPLSGKGILVSERIIRRIIVARVAALSQARP